MVDLSALQLSPPAFASLLALSTAAIVCGDGSLTEVLAQQGTPFWYSADGHKVFTGQALKAIVQGGGQQQGERTEGRTGIPAVSALWSYLESGTNQHWERVLRVGVAREQEEAQEADKSGHGQGWQLWEAVRQGFKALAGQILDRDSGMLPYGGAGIPLPLGCGRVGCNGLPVPRGDLGAWLGEVVHLWSSTAK